LVKQTIYNMELDTKYFSDKTVKFVSAFILLIIFLPGCKKSGFFIKAGDIKTVILQMEDFEEIILNDKINLVLTYDTINQISLKAGENLIHDIETSVADKKLTIRDNNKYKWTRDLDYNISVHVSSDHLRKISYHGAGNITTTNVLKANEFIVDSWTGIGSFNLQLESGYTELIIRMANADFTLKGTSRFTRVYCADHGSVNLRDFKSNEMLIDYRSIRNSSIYVTSFLTANILYKGNIYYRGDPELKPFYNSSGKLIPDP
jgi:hypothetical protein